MSATKTIRALLCGVVLTYAHVVAAAEQPSVVLSLEPAVTLPSLPVAFLVTIDNPSNDPIIVADAAKLRVTTAAGTFDANGVAHSIVNLPRPAVTPCGGDAQCIAIPPHGRKQVYFDYGPTLGENEFFHDDRLSEPGTFQLQLVLYVDNDDSLSEVPSNTVSLLVQQPSGADAAVWALLRQGSPTHRWAAIHWIVGGNAAAEKIRREFPTSRYVPYVAALGHAASPSASVSFIDAALSQNPTPSLRDNLLLTKASFLNQISRDALYADRNLDVAMQLASEARTAYETVRKVAISDVSRQEAADGLKTVLTEGPALETLRQFAEWDGPAPAHVVPKVECVSKGQGEAFTVQFGYVNPNDNSKALQISDDNQVTPAPRDQGQPRIFRPGAHTSVFVAKSPGGVLKWRLDGNEAVATAESAPPCGSSIAPPLAAGHH
jgi:hypothetical protein